MIPLYILFLIYLVLWFLLLPGLSPTIISLSCPVSFGLSWVTAFQQAHHRPFFPFGFARILLSTIGLSLIAE